MTLEPDAAGADEQPLTGGNASTGVVRVGDTVRKPWLDTTPFMVTWLAQLRDAGLDVPCVHGRDERGRVVLEYVPGVLALHQAPLPPDTVHRVGAEVRALHDVSATLPVPRDWPVGLMPAPTTEFVCHNGLAPWNLVIDGDRLVFIDWDAAAPSSRAWDLAWAALGFAHLFPDADPAGCAERLRAFADGYGAQRPLRAVLPDLMAERAAAMHGLLRSSWESGHEPWATMHVAGHGRHWSGTTAFIRQHRPLWEKTLRQ